MVQFVFKIGPVGQNDTERTEPIPLKISRMQNRSALLLGSKGRPEGREHLLGGGAGGGVGGGRLHALGGVGGHDGAAQATAKRAA